MSESNAGPLQNKVAVITGSGRGIGRAIALGYAKAGAAIVCAARTAGEIAETATLIKSAGGRAIAHSADVGDYDSVATLFQRAGEEFGGIDIVVANAGVVSERRSVADSDPALWRK